MASIGSMRNLLPCFKSLSCGVLQSNHFCFPRHQTSCQELAKICQDPDESQTVRKDTPRINHRLPRGITKPGSRGPFVMFRNMWYVLRMHPCLFFFHTAGQGTRSIPLVAASRTDPPPLRFLPFQHWFGSDRPTAIACWILAGVAAVALILLIPVVELPAPLRQAAPVALHRFQLLLAFILAAVPI